MNFKRFIGTFLFLLLVLPCSNAVQSKVSMDDIKKTVEHMQAIVHQQEAELDAVTAENATIKQESTKATDSLTAATMQLSALQTKITEQTKQLNEAEGVIRDLRKQLAALEKRYHFDKTILCFQAAGLLLLLALYMRLPALFPPYSLYATVALPVIVFALAWKFF